MNTFPEQCGGVTVAYVGLVRVSTDRQETQRQHDALDALCVRVFEETVSGTKKAADRPGLRAALDYLRPEDFLTVQEADRLGRNLLDGLITLTELFQRGVNVKILDGVAAGEHTERNLVLDLSLALAEDRRRDISRKTRNGLDAARARGTTGGRPSVVTDDTRRAILSRRAEGESLRQIARGVGISAAVVHRVTHEAEQPPHTPTAPDPAPQDPPPDPHEQQTAPTPRTVPPEPSPRSGADGPRALAPGELVDPDTVATDRDAETGISRVTGTARDGSPVLVGFLARAGRQWQPQTPHKNPRGSPVRTKHEALLRLLAEHTPSQVSVP